MSREKWREYAEKKKKLNDKVLTQEQYDREIQRILDELDL